MGLDIPRARAHRSATPTASRPGSARLAVRRLQDLLLPQLDNLIDGPLVDSLPSGPPCVKRRNALYVQKFLDQGIELIHILTEDTGRDFGIQSTSVFVRRLQARVESILHFT